MYQDSPPLCITALVVATAAEYVSQVHWKLVGVQDFPVNSAVPEPDAMTLADQGESLYQDGENEPAIEHHANTIGHDRNIPLAVPTAYCSDICCSTARLTASVDSPAP